MASLHIVRGWPGSGKSTFARKKFSGVLLLENDMFHMHNGVYDWHKEAMHDAIAWCSSTTRAALNNGMDVVVANTFTKRRFIEAYKKIADDCGASFDVYRCTGNFHNVHGLDESMVDSFKRSMEDWPGEIYVQPEAKMTWEVYDLSNDEVHGQFPSLIDADMFLAGIDEDLAQRVHARPVE